MLMSISEKQSVRANAGRRKRRKRYFSGGVVSNAQIEKFVAGLRHGELWDMAALMQAVIDAARHPVGGKVDETSLRLIKSAAALDSTKRYRWIMAKIIAAMEEGTEKGTYAAFKTALRAMEIAFECSPNDDQARERFKRLLKRGKRGKRNN
jgi:hypothetical protein